MCGGAGTGPIYVGTSEQLRELAEDVSRREVGSRDLDAQIWWATSDYSATDAGILARTTLANVTELCDELWGPTWRTYAAPADSPRAWFTSSLDAVHALHLRCLPESPGLWLIVPDHEGGMQAEVGDSLAGGKTLVGAYLAAVLLAVADLRETEE